MTIEQVISLAKGGELKQLAIDDEDIVGYINLGMLELYKRFPLKTEEYIIDLVEGQTDYTMPSDYMWIVAAYGEILEDEVATVTVKSLPVNKEDDPNSINTSSWNGVQIPLVVDGGRVSIIYAAAPTTYTVGDMSVDIELPLQMIEALLTYMAYCGHGTIDSEVQTESSVHYQRFEAACDRLLIKGMFNEDDMYMDTRLVDRCFV